MKLVTICIAAYNAEKYIDKAMESALNQTYQNIEILVCDDCSTDKTLEILKSYKDKRIKLFVNNKNLGYLQTFNKLLSLSQGEFVCFVDADDFIDKRKVFLQLNFLINNPEISLVGSGVCRIDESGNVVSKENFPEIDENIKNYLELNSNVCFIGSSVMIRKKVIDTIGGYREYFMGCPAEDYDWLRRISEKFKCANLKENLYFYRFAEGSLSRIVHYDVKSRHAAEIAKFLSDQRKIHKVDSLTNKSLVGLKEFVESINKEYKKSPGLLYRRTAFENVLNNNFLIAMKDLKISLSKERLNLSFIKTCIMIFIVLIFPNSFLLKIKSLFGLKNVSDKLI